jgi:hypothetical protein
MFDRSKISAISGIVGWQQPYNPDYAILDATNLASVSGRYVNENELAKVEYIKDSQDYAGISDDNFNDKLVKLQETSILDVMDKVFNQPDFIDRQVLYRFANNKINTDSLPVGFVGYEIKKDNTKNVAIEIKRDLLEFSGAGDVTLVLYNSNKKAVIESQLVTIASDLQEIELNWRLDNESPLYMGDLYYGYFTQGVSVLPFKRDYEGADVQSAITHLCIQNIQVPDATSGDLFDLTLIESAEESWGLNPDFTVFYDYTDLILQNEFLFGKAIQMQCQIQALTIGMASLRTNRNEREGDTMMNRILVELEGTTEGTGIKKVGLGDKLTGEINRIRKEIDRLQRGYFPKGILSITRTR